MMNEAIPAPGAPEPPRREPWLRWVLLGCGGTLVLAAVFAASMFFLIKKATAGPEETVKTFLAAAGSGDYAAAHDCFSAPLKQAQPLEQFSAVVQGNPLLFQVTDTTFNNRSVSTEGAKLSGTLMLQSGTSMPASFDLVTENGTWKLIAYNIGPQ